MGHHEDFNCAITGGVKADRDQLWRKKASDYLSNVWNELTSTIFGPVPINCKILAPTYRQQFHLQIKDQAHRSSHLLRSYWSSRILIHHRGRAPRQKCVQLDHPAGQGFFALAINLYMAGEGGYVCVSHTNNHSSLPGDDPTYSWGSHHCSKFTEASSYDVAIIAPETTRASSWGSVVSFRTTGASCLGITLHLRPGSQCMFPWGRYTLHRLPATTSDLR